MHHIFQTFIDRLSDAGDVHSLQASLSEAAAAFDLSCFAYLSMPSPSGSIPRLISNYPPAWTKRYLENRFERFVQAGG